MRAEPKPTIINPESVQHAQYRPVLARAGTHHAFPSHGSGFCILNDLAFTARQLLSQRSDVQRVLILDLDVHQARALKPYYMMGVILHDSVKMSSSELDEASDNSNNVMQFTSIRKVQYTSHISFTQL